MTGIFSNKNNIMDESERIKGVDNVVDSVNDLSTENKI
jgi:hypothetical protein